MAKIGLLHPGEMGSSIGAAARSADSDVTWASDGRSVATRKRAEADGLRDVGSLADLVAGSEVILSVCPPEFAGEQADAVFGLGFQGLYVDANAIRPQAARDIAAAAADAGASFVDGGIVGPPARREGSCFLCLSGTGAKDVAALFEGSLVSTVVLEGGPGAASALKMSYAAYTKGSSALLLAVRALARAEGVEEALLEQWARTHPQNAALSEATARGTAPKAWRFAPEMEEIAETFAGAGLPDGFHRAAAELYARMAGLKDADRASVTLDNVLARLLSEDDGGS